MICSIFIRIYVLFQLNRLEEVPGCEETMLQELFEWSEKEGISLPVRSSATDPIGQSSMSLNQAAVSDSETAIESLWSQISLKMRRYFVDKLTKLPVLTNQVINFTSSTRLQCVQSLCSLYSPADIWRKYLSIRSTQYRAMTLTYTASRSKEVHSFPNAVAHFEVLMTKARIMIMEDFGLVNSGVFGNATTAMNAVRDIYFDQTIDEISSIVDSLETELTQIKHNSSRKTKDKQEFPKSSSETTKMNKKRGAFRKQNSKSMDTLLSPSSCDLFTDLQWVPTNNMDLQVRMKFVIV